MMKSFSQKSTDDLFKPWHHCTFTLQPENNIDVVGLAFEIPTNAITYELIYQWSEPDDGDVSLVMSVVLERKGYTTYIYRTYKGEILPEYMCVASPDVDLMEIQSFSSNHPKDKGILLVTQFMSDGGDVLHQAIDQRWVFLEKFTVKNRNDLSSSDFEFGK